LGKAVGLEYQSPPPLYFNKPRRRDAVAAGEGVLFGADAGAMARDNIAMMDKSKVALIMVAGTAYRVIS